jgi:signal recognition particle subunit SRP68
MMDITSFVVQGRDKALLYGDYSTYHAQLAKKLLNSRKKLGIATKNRGKFTKKDQVTAENVAQNHEYVHDPSMLRLNSQSCFSLTVVNLL